MTIREWIREQEIHGFPTFSFEDVRRTFPNRPIQIIKNDLYRLSSQTVISSVYKGFYVIIPPQYAARGVVPPMYYIDQLMIYLNKSYYISLLSAAEILGAAHQRTQRFSVTTVLPKSSISQSKNKLLLWSYRKEMPSDFLLTRNSETGTIHYSNAELTAIDIVQYEQHIGGLSRAATVLEELSEQLDFRHASEGLFRYTTITTIQRLGYILEEVLKEKKTADILYEELLSYAGNFKYVPLSIRKPEKNTEKNTRWKINVNSIIETDEI